jgi:hypothetical protein
MTKDLKATHENAAQGRSAHQDLRHLWSPLHLAQEMGEGVE